MKLNLFFILFLSFPFLLSAQFDYDVSSPYKVVDGEKFYVGEEDKMLAVKRHRKEVHIQIFSSTKPELSHTQVYSDTELPKGFVIEKLLAFGDKYYLFFNVWDKANLTEQLYYREINFDKGEFIGKNEVLLKIEGKITGSPLFRFNQRYSYSAGGLVPGISINLNGSKKFGFSLSQNKSKLIVQYRKKPLEKKDTKSKDIMGMFVYSHGMEKHAGGEVEMPYTEKKMNNLDYTVDANGTPYILAKVFTNNTTRESSKNPDGKGKIANYQIELLKIDLEAEKILSTPIKTEDKFITKIALYESVDNDLVCTGYYNTSGPTKTRGANSFFGAVTPHTDGICMFKIKKSGGVSDINYYEIPVEIMNQYERKGTQKRNERKDGKGKAQFEYLTLRESLVQDDGSLIIIGEQYHIKSSSSSTTISAPVPVPGGFGGSTRQSPPQHLYEDVLIAKINPDGKLAWMRKLPKRQMSDKSAKGGMSVKYIHDKSNGKHYLMYLDNVKNLELDINKIPKRHIDGKGGFLTSFKIDDATGNVSKENLFDLRDVKGVNVYQFNTDRIVHTSENEVVVEVYKKGKQDILIKIKIK
jgi:hypothetical protein